MKFSALRITKTFFRKKHLCGSQLIDIVLREIFYLNIYFRTMRWSYIVNGLRKLNKDEFSGLLVSGIIRKQIKTIESIMNIYFYNKSINRK